MSNLRMGVPRGPPESGREESSETPCSPLDPRVPEDPPSPGACPRAAERTPEAEPGLRGAS